MAEEHVPRGAFLTAGALVVAALGQDDEEIATLIDDMTPEEFHEVSTAMFILCADTFRVQAEMQQRDPIEYAREFVGRMASQIWGD